MSSLPLYLALALTAALSFALKRRSRLPLPPSPTWYPVIGNVLSMPRTHVKTGFVELGKKLGSDIFSLRFFGTTIIVLNSAQPAIELFEKRSNIYSDRFLFPALREPSLMNWATFLPATRYGDLHKKHRRMMHMWLNKQAVTAFHPSQQQQARAFLQRMLNTKGKVFTSEYLHKEFSRTFSGTLLQSIYGYKIQTLDDPFMTEAEKAIEHFIHAATTSTFLVNTFPFLLHLPDWFPGTQWKKTLREWGRHKDVTVKGMVEWTKEQLANGCNEPSIVASFLGEISKWGRNEAEATMSIQEVAIGLFAGGTDTGVSSLIAFVTAMLLFPDVQAKAQKEIDTVIATGRLPSIEDQPNLPYIRRVMLECARWQPAIPLAVPHRCTEDNEYRGYSFPQGSIVFGNIWAMSRDESVYPDPETFNPDRFLDPTVPPAPVFGWGRRLCPGMHYSDSSLFIMIASMLATYNIVPPTDKSGSLVYPSTKCENFAVFRPTPFECRFVPRSDSHVELVRNGV